MTVTKELMLDTYDQIWIHKDLWTCEGYQEHGKNRNVNVGIWGTKYHCSQSHEDE